MPGRMQATLLLLLAGGLLGILAWPLLGGRLPHS